MSQPDDGNGAYVAEDNAVGTSANSDAVISVLDVVVLNDKVGSTSGESIRVKRERLYPENVKNCPISQRNAITDLGGRHRVNPVIEHTKVLCAIERKVPRDRLPNLHILYDSVRHLEIDSVRAVRLLDGVPPLLTMCVDPAPAGSGRASKGHISAGDFDPVAREGLNGVCQ